MIKIQTDSKKVISGDTFFAIVGENYDGHDYIEEAIKNGAEKIVCEYGKYDLETIIVPDTKEALNKCLETEYNYLINDLTFIGITGTNGKTTTSFLTYQLIDEIGMPCAYIGTIGFYIRDKLIRELDNTTPDVLETYKLIEEARIAGAKCIVMEVSSHALDQNRLAGISFDIGAFTNLTQDHLDYHGTMEKYLEAKKIILSKIKPKGMMVVNVDDEYSKYFMHGNYATVGIKGEDYRIDKCVLELGKSSIRITTKDEIIDIQNSLTGEFNVYNYVTAFAIVDKLGYNYGSIISATKHLKTPPGRLQTIDVFGAIAVIDYAHTPDAVEKIIDTINDLTKGNVITTLGCGGDRDPLKRPIMAQLATEKSDFVIFTNDNPRNENPDKIIADMLTGTTNKNYLVIPDRATAIRKGLEMLMPEDAFLILGKGHENYQIIGHEKQHFDDAEEVEKYKLSKQEEQKIKDI